MSNTSNNSTNNNLYNICSLEHCYTNLFALTDITGIKWLRLRAKEKQKSSTSSSSASSASSNPNSNSNSNSNKQKKKNRQQNSQDDENDEDDEDEDNMDQDDEEDTEMNEASTPASFTKQTEEQSNQSHKQKSQFINTTCINDPVLLTHSKCLNEDILCSWKRVEASSLQNQQQHQQQEPQQSATPLDDEDSFKKELWIFWYEKEEPANLRALISADLVLDQSQSSQNTNQNQQNTSQHENENILSMASSSLNALPYEARSMLFKALHNLIEKSLLEKGYARLGKWFVMPYNLNSVNYSIYNPSIETNDSSSVLLNPKAPATSQPVPSQAAPQTPSNVHQSRSASKLNSNINPTVSSTSLTSSQIQVDESNHVSYSFSFFLHGASRVCTSVDIKLHKPIRLVNNIDLIYLKENLKSYLLFSSSSSSSRSSCLPACHFTNNRGKKRRKKFLGQKVILAPYAISARLLGYLSNDSVESKMTCEEWKQFYPLKLIQSLPNVFVVGIDKNKIKLFYPNCFIYIVMDSDSDKSDDDDLNHVNLTDNEMESSLDEDGLSGLNSSNCTSESSDAGSDDQDYDDDYLQSRAGSLKYDLGSKSTKSNKNKEMDSLDLTIDSVARNFGTLKQNTCETNKPESSSPPPPQSNQTFTNKSILSMSLTSPMSVTAISSPASVQSPSTAQSPQSARRTSIVSSMANQTQVNSPGKQSLKRTKSSNLNRSMSVVEPLAPPLSNNSVGAANKSVKKRKKNLDSSSSDLSLNNTSANLNVNLNVNVKPSDLTLDSASKKKVRMEIGLGGVGVEVAASGAKSCRPGGGGRPARNGRHKKMNFLLRKNFKKIKKIQNSLLSMTSVLEMNNDAKKFKHKIQLLNSSQIKSRKIKTRAKKNKSQSHSLLSCSSSSSSLSSSSHSSRQARETNDCCKYKFNLNKNLTNQIRLKHKKFDLLVENIPLAFDILDKCSLSTCSNFTCATPSSLLNCARCSCVSNEPKSKKCDCAAPNPPNPSPTKKGLATAFSSTASTINNLANANDRTGAIKLNLPFHKRNCYFNHSKPPQALRKYRKYLNKFKTSSNTVTLNKKLQAIASSSKTRLIRVRNESLVSKKEDKDDYESDSDSDSLASSHRSSSIRSNDDQDYDDLEDDFLNNEDDVFEDKDKDSVCSFESAKTDPDMLDYQYFEKDENDSLLGLEHVIKKEAKAKGESSPLTSDNDSSTSSSSTSTADTSDSDSTDSYSLKTKHETNRSCFTNLTNKSFNSKLLSVNNNNNNNNNNHEFKFKKLADYRNEENEVWDDAQGSLNNLNSDCEAEDRSFDNFYDTNCQVANDYDDLLNTQNVDSNTLLNSITKSSQMTPPKSVESFQTPLSNNSMFASSNLQTGAGSSSHHTQHHSNAANIAPISYDDLNNIFEEESSTDEQSQQLQQPQTQLQQQQQQQQQQNMVNATNQLNSHLNTIQTSLSVVMTPPSHESVLKPNQMSLMNNVMNEDEILNLVCLNEMENGLGLSLSSSNLNRAGLDRVGTRTILFNDLETILGDSKRKKFLPLEEASTVLFNIPRLGNNVSINKYKPVKLGVVRNSLFLSDGNLAGFRWKLSSKNINQNSKKIKILKSSKTSEKSLNSNRQDLQINMPLLDKPISVTNHLPKLLLNLKPIDQFYAQIDPTKFNKINLNLNKYLNSACLSVNLSDTLLNVHRDINFDSCTLCVCTNNNIKGLDYPTYICTDILDTNEASISANNNLHNTSSNSHSGQQYVSCTCGFSSIVNRGLLTRTATAVRLNKLIKIVERLKLEANEQNLVIPYYSLVNLLNRLTKADSQQKQLILMDSGNYNGLFLEDYVDVLMITEPHYLLYDLMQESSKFVLNQSLVTKKFLNSILIRENYQWKKSLCFDFKPPVEQAEPDAAATPNAKLSVGKKAGKNCVNLNSVDEKLLKKQSNEFELVELCAGENAGQLGVLDLFDQKYSTPLLSAHESFDLFYLNGQQFDLNESLDLYNLFDLNSKLSGKMKRFLSQKLNLVNLARYDENNVCLNVIKRLSQESPLDDDDVSLKDSKFLLHNWLYSKKEIKSNLEVTKSLKLIQPLLEETVQKKYTTSRMWESFQGPLTWQHFCRLAFRDSGGSQQNRHHTINQSGSAHSGSSSSAQSQANQANQSLQNSYEPEPIPALLVSSVDKDWLTISPYSIKFWDKLNLEPYSKPKNIAYLVIMPEFNQLSDKEAVNEFTEFETTTQCVKDYFKELNSVYELCRLGLHRPALRLAPDHGFVRVNLDTSSKSAKQAKMSANVKVNEWFTKIQTNRETRQLGRHLKAYAKSFKSLAIKITQGSTSTISNTVEGSLFPSETLNNRVKNTTSFHQSSSQTIPTVSAINLDKSIYEELKQAPVNSQHVPSQITQNQLSSTPSLSNLLNQPIGNDLLLNPTDFNHHHSPLDFGSSSNPVQAASQQQGVQLQAQILNFGNTNDLDGKEASYRLDSASHQYHQQQQTLNNIAAGSNLTQISQLTANINCPPALLIYIIDPFDNQLYNTLIDDKRHSKKSVDDPGAQKKESSDIEDDEDELNEAGLNENEQINEFDLRRLRTLGLFKAYLEFYNNVPDLFKYSTQFQVIPLSLCVDLQQQSTSMYMQSMMMHNKLNSSNYSSYYSSGFGTGWSDLDMDFKLSMLKTQAFNVFALSKRYFMSPAHNYYLNLHQQQNNSLRPKTLTCFGPAAYEERFLHETLLNNSAGNNTKFSQLRKLQFYSPLFILAPSTITTSAVSLAASNLFFKNSEFQSSKLNQQNSNQQNSTANGAGESISQMPHFIQLNMSNSNYGFLNTNNTYNFSLNEVINQQQQLQTNTSSNPLLNSAGAVQNGLGTSGSTGAGSQLGQSSSNQSTANTSNFQMSQPHQQQCNVLYVGYCLSDDQRYLLTSCCDENGELIESTSILIEVDERFRRKENHVRRIALRKLWEFIIAIISQTCKPWRLVIGRLGRMGHSELRGWACLLSKKNLQRVCQMLKDNCDACNILGNLEAPCILSACLISMETCETICVYPESYSREDKIAAAALTGQQQLLSNHAAQSHGVSCTHILTFPASAIIQTQSSSMTGSGMKDNDPLSKSALGAMPMEDDFFDLFKFEEEEMNELLSDNINDKVLNESGAANEADHASMKEKVESLLNQEEMAHLDQQPLAVGYYVSTAKCGPLPKWLRAGVSLDTNFHTFKATLHIHNRYALENDELIMKTDNSHKLDSSVTYEVLRYVLERYNALSWLNIDPLMQDRKSCLPIHHSILLQMYYAFKNYI